jgi:hypothetical protein
MYNMKGGNPILFTIICFSSLLRHLRDLFALWERTEGSRCISWSAALNYKGVTLWRLLLAEVNSADWCLETGWFLLWGLDTVDIGLINY